MLRGYLILIFFINSSFLCAQIISGTITHPKSNQPVPFVNVSLEGTYNGTVSDANRNYKLRIPQGKTYTVYFSCIGYETLEVSQKKLAISPGVNLKPFRTH